MSEYKRKLLEFLKSTKKSISELENFVIEYLLNLLNKSRKAGLWFTINDIKNFTQEEGIAFEKRVNEILNKQYE